MDFTDVSSEQAMAIMSHARAISEVSGRFITASVCGTGVDKAGELVFLSTLTHIIMPPTKGYFRLMVDGKPCSVRFEEGFDLRIEYS